MVAPISMTNLRITLHHESPADFAEVEKLNQRAFGPGRFTRSSERVREEAGLDLSMCFVARVATLLVGSVRQTPIRIGAAKALLLGPLAVEPAFRSRGIGRLLMEKAVSEAQKAGYRLVLLVGDEAYYGRLAFRRVPPGSIVMPGPVDPQRVLLWAADDEARLLAKGVVHGA